MPISTKPRVWLKASFIQLKEYTLLDSAAIPDVLTAKTVLEITRPGLPVHFFHVFFMGVTFPRDDVYGIAAFEDEENMFDHAPGARDIYLRVDRVPLTSAEVSLTFSRDPSLSAHLIARPPCAPEPKPRGMFAP